MKRKSMYVKFCVSWHWRQVLPLPGGTDVDVCWRAACAPAAEPAPVSMTPATCVVLPFCYGFAPDLLPSCASVGFVLSHLPVYLTF